MYTGGGEGGGRKRRNRQQIPLLNCKGRRWEFCTLSMFYEVRPFHSCYSLLGVFAKLRKATISFVMSVRPSAWIDSAPTGRIFMRFYIWAFFENLSRKFRFHYNLPRITGILHEDQYILLFWEYLTQFFPEWKFFSDKSCRENQNTHFMFINPPPTKSCCLWRLWDDVEKHGRAWQATRQYGTCALHAGYLRLQAHTQNMWYVHCLSCLCNFMLENVTMWQGCVCLNCQHIGNTCVKYTQLPLGVASSN
jgi:hypothetical protein